MPSRMACTELSLERSRSVSSMRRTNCPPVARAASQANSAVLAPPICKSPVGEGAKRVLTGGLTLDMAILQTGDKPAILTDRSEEHTSELQSRGHLVCRLLHEKKK